MARVIPARLTAFAIEPSPWVRPLTSGEVEVGGGGRIEVRRRQRRNGEQLLRCGVLLEPAAIAELACDLVLSLPPSLVIARLGVGDGSTQLVRLLQRLAEGETR